MRTEFSVNELIRHNFVARQEDSLIESSLFTQIYQQWRFIKCTYASVTHAKNINCILYEMQEDGAQDIVKQVMIDLLF